MEAMDVGTYIRSSKGNALVSLNGYLYRKSGVAQGKGYWVCSQDHKRRCRGRIHVKDDTDPPVVVMKCEDHNHKPNYNDLEGRRLLNIMKKKALETLERTTAIYDNTLTQEKATSEVIKCLGPRSQITNLLRQTRRYKNNFSIDGDPEFNIRFVKLLKTRAGIYDKDVRNFMTKYEVTEMWKNFAQELGAPVVSCKNKWLSIKNNLSRYLREEQKTQQPWHYLLEHLSFLVPFVNKSGDNEAFPPTLVQTGDWAIVSKACENENDQSTVTSTTTVHDDDAAKSEDKWTFHTLNGSESPSASAETSSSCSDVVVECLPDDESSTVAMTELLRGMKRRRDEEEDADICFLKSLQPDMRKMTPTQKHKFKIGVLDLIQVTMYNTADTS